MRGASTNPQGEPVGEPDSQPHYRFTRQPVKYYRHHNPGARPCNPGRAARQPATPTRASPGSADSSRSSSPEPRLPKNLDARCENARQPHRANDSGESKADVPPSPREVVQYMLGLDSEATTSSGTTRASPRAGGTADRNINPPGNNRQYAGQSRVLSQSPKTLPVDHNLSSPAQKILSGLKLRRSHSGKDEQLFV